MDAITEKEIIKYNIISSVDTVVSEGTKKRIREEIARRGLIRRQWDSILGTPLTFESKRFFVYLASVLKEHVAQRLADLYRKENLSCFVLLPYPREKRSKHTEGFEQYLEDCLGSREISIEFLTPAIIDRKMSANWLTQVKEGEKLLILQPMAMNDDYLNKAIAYVRECSLSSIVEVLTIVDASGRPADKRSKDPPERVLIELNLRAII